MKVLLTLLFVLTATFAQAQSIIKSLERNIPGQGKVTIHQDPRIEALIGMERPATGEQKVIKTSGFRIQAYAGNNTRQAKNDAYHVASRVKEYFPELTVYTSFNPPRWLCRVGDFRSRGSSRRSSCGASRRRWCPAGSQYANAASTYGGRGRAIR